MRKTESQETGWICTCSHVHSFSFSLPLNVIQTGDGRSESHHTEGVLIKVCLERKLREHQKDWPRDPGSLPFCSLSPAAVTKGDRETCISFVPDFASRLFLILCVDSVEKEGGERNRAKGDLPCARHRSDQPLRGQGPHRAPTNAQPVTQFHGHPEGFQHHLEPLPSEHLQSSGQERPTCLEYGCSQALNQPADWMDG